MAVSLILVMGMLAFIINVGLFVKAKINLQNAVDAAAFSGAATQSRQLTNIAYANWEMRNTFKEWMFKYYVLGQVSLTRGTNSLSDGRLASGDRTSFLLETPSVAGNAGFDKFNIPSICVHLNSSNDICPLFSLPGIPRFPALGVAGISDVHESLVNKLVDEKGANCSQRTQMNFLTALSWAYSSGIREIPGAPIIGTSRVGAWPQALELAMRIRNLEMIMNRPPVNEITFDNLDDLANVGQSIGLNERPVKAFMSAFRNLGGGKYKDVIDNGGCSGGQPCDELPATFKLTELSPVPYQAQTTNVSGFLIPPSFTYQGGVSISALTKHYVDLQAVPVNYATIFSTFASTRNEFEPSVAMEATCNASKSALPVPGYILGFVKNPQVLTYYAVKGEADFTGLFFPNSDGSIKLTAYAAAKPHGGRIGPRLFTFRDSDQSVHGREDSNSRSSSYISGLEIPIAATGFSPGMPIPSSQSFWANTGVSVLGGVPESGLPATFGIPNLIYEFSSINDLEAQGGAGVTKVQSIRERILPPTGSISEDKGLYQSYQMRELKSNLGNAFNAGNVSSNQLLGAIIKARRVTRYDAANYLIPDITPATNTGSKTNAAPTAYALSKDNPGAFALQLTDAGVGYYYRLFAPLVGDDLLYKTNTEVGGIVFSYMSSMEPAVDSYLDALLEVGNNIYNLPTGTGAGNLNAQAARSIHANADGVTTNSTPPELSSPDPQTAVGCNLTDMASKFHHFFTKQNTQCGIIPLKEMMIGYIDKQNQNGGNMYYTSTYYNPLPSQKIMTAYYPGERQGSNVGEEALSKNPINAPIQSYSTRRNFYSTKFVQLEKVMADTGTSFRDGILRESDTVVPIDLTGLNVLNLLRSDGTGELGTPFFRDF
jgi:hypothetical protein